MLKLGLRKPQLLARSLSSASRLSSQFQEKIFAELATHINERPNDDPTDFIFHRLEELHPNGHVPFSKYQSLFTWLTEQNQRHAAIQVFSTMREKGYASLCAMEAKLLVMLMEDVDPDEKGMHRAFASRLVSLVQDEEFTEQDMFAIVRLSDVQQLNRSIMLLAMTAFYHGKGGADSYIPALDLLPVAVEALVRSGTVDEAFRLLQHVGHAFMEEVPPEIGGKRHLGMGLPERQSILRDLETHQPKFAFAARHSLRTAYSALLTSLRDVNLWGASHRLIERVLRILNASGVFPDTNLHNLVLSYRVHSRQYPQAAKVHRLMRQLPFERGQRPNEETYDTLYSMWEARLATKELDKYFDDVRPRPLFAELLNATEPLVIKSGDIQLPSPIPTITTADGETAVKPLRITDDLLQRTLRALLFQHDYAAVYIALSYFTSETAGLEIQSWHAMYYHLVFHLVRRAYAEGPGRFGEAKWTEGFLGTALRRKDALVPLPTYKKVHVQPETIAGSVGSSMAERAKDKDKKKRNWVPWTLRIPINAQTANYVLEVIARDQWSITDGMYPISGSLPAEYRTNLFLPLPSSAQSATQDEESLSNPDATEGREGGRTSESPPQPTSTSNPNTETQSTSSLPFSSSDSSRTTASKPPYPKPEFKYSVPSIFMMEHVDLPNLPAGFVWAVEPLQRLLLRAMYADEIFAYRTVGRPRGYPQNDTGYRDHPLELPDDVREECIRRVEARLEEAHAAMLPLPKHRTAVKVRMDP